MPSVLEYLGSEAALKAGFGNDTANVIGSLTPGILSMGFGGFGGAGLRALGSGAGRIAGWTPRVVDFVSELATGERLIGKTLHQIFDGTRFQGAMQKTADWLRLKACFGAGTKLLAKGPWGQGWREIERITTDDFVASRDEHHPTGRVEWKAVEELFQRTAAVISLTLSGQIIRTTSEHPFYHAEKGWTPAGELEIGDHLVGKAGELIIVDAVEEGGEFEAVYNLRVADYHTYFVGDDGCGFAAWAHNANYSVEEALIKNEIVKTTRKRAGILTEAELNPQHHLLPQQQTAWFAARRINVDNYTVSIPRARTNSQPMLTQAI